MSDPEKQLLRLAERQGQSDLSGPTGLSRLNLTEQTLSAGESLTLNSGREQFCYVLGGAGDLKSTRQQPGSDQAETATASLNAGDFVALAADEEAVIRAEPAALTVLIGMLIGQLIDGGPAGPRR